MGGMLNIGIASGVIPSDSGCGQRMESMYLKKAPRAFSISVEPTNGVSGYAYPTNVGAGSTFSGGSYVHNSYNVDENEPNWQDLQESMKSIASSGAIRLPMRKDRAPRVVDDPKIRDALELPPATNTKPALLMTDHISTCSFYKNHQPPHESQSIQWRPRGRVITQLTDHEGSGF